MPPPFLFTLSSLAMPHVLAHCFCVPIFIPFIAFLQANLCGAGFNAPLRHPTIQSVPPACSSCLSWRCTVGGSSRRIAAICKLSWSASPLSPSSKPMTWGGRCCVWSETRRMGCCRFRNAGMPSPPPAGAPTHLVSQGEVGLSGPSVPGSPSTGAHSYRI